MSCVWSCGMLCRVLFCFGGIVVRCRERNPVARDFVARALSSGSARQARIDLCRGM